MAVHYDPFLIIVSVLVAIFASYTSLGLSSNVAQAKGLPRAVWLGGGAVAMGIGIWSMHFIGMLSFSMPNMEMGYDVPLTLLSIFIAVAASATALYLVSLERVSNFVFILAGLTMGLAIAGMHYTGMASMRMAARIEWNYSLVALSYGIAAAASLMALWVCFRLRDELRPGRRRLQVVGGVIMGIAIAGMHYTGMLAAKFVHTGEVMAVSSGVIATSNLTLAVTAGTLVILGLAVAGSALDRAWARKTSFAEESRALYQQADQALASLKEERLLREKFVSSLTHDLRTPLTTAKLNAEMLERRAMSLTSDERKLLYRIEDSISRAETMIHDLLDVQRISAKQPLPLEKQPSNLVQIAKDAIEGLQTVYGDRFVIKAPNSLVGNWDASYLRRLVENLCSNAVKYGVMGRPITVHLKEHSGEVEIRVHNEGAPIPAEDQEKLFSLFHRGSLAQTSGNVGWGIGLTLVKGVAESHGGSASVESSEGAGTTFVVRLPKAG